MSLTIEQDMAVRSALADLHERCFTNDMKLTLVARHPEKKEQYLVLGDDDLSAVAELIQTLGGDSGELVDSTWIEEMGGRWWDHECMVMNIGQLELLFTGDLTMNEKDTSLSLIWEYRVPGGSKVRMTHCVSDNPTRGEVRTLCLSLGYDLPLTK